MAGLFAFGRLLLWPLFGARCRVRDAALAQRVREVGLRLGVSRGVRLLESGSLRAPIAFGVLRPTIVLPTRFAEISSPGRQEVILAHELAHLAASDPCWHLLADCAAAWLWWHPAVWWLRSRLRAASEAAVDEASRVVSNGPRLLAECLVELDRDALVPPLLAVSGLGMAGFGSTLGQRVELLLRLQSGSWDRPSRRAVFVMKALGLLSVGAAVVGGTAWRRPGALNEGDPMKTMWCCWNRPLALLALAGSLPAGEPLQPVRPASAGSPSAPGSLPQAAADDAPAVEPSPATDPAHQRMMMQRYGIRVAWDSGTPSTSADEAMRLRYGLRPARGASAIEPKLDAIAFEEVEFSHLSLSEVLRCLADETRRRDPAKKGLNFLIVPTRPRSDPVIDPTTGSLTAPAAEQIDVGALVVHFNLPLRDVRLKDVLDAVVQVTDRPIHYLVEVYAVETLGGKCSGTEPASSSADRPGAGGLAGGGGFGSGYGGISNGLGGGRPLAGAAASPEQPGIAPSSSSSEGPPSSEPARENAP